MAIVKVQSTGRKATSTTEVANLAFAMTSPVTEGNHILVWASYRVAAGSGRDWGTASVTDSLGNTYTRVTKAPNDLERRAAIFACRSIASGTPTITCAPTGGNTTIIACAVEVSGLRSTTFINAYAAVNGATTQAVHTGMPDFATQANCFVFAGWHAGSLVDSLAIDSPSNWTQEFLHLPTTSNPGGMCVSRISTDIQQHFAKFDAGTLTGDVSGAIAVFAGVDDGTASDGEAPGVNASQVMSFASFHDESEPTSTQIAFGPFGPAIFTVASATPGLEELAAAVPWPVAGTFKNLIVHRAVAVGTGDRSYGLRINRHWTPLSVRFTGTQTNRRNTSRSVHVNAGDLVSMGHVKTGSPTGAGLNGIRYTIEFEPDTAKENFYGWGMRTATSLSTSATQWAGVFQSTPDVGLAAVTSGEMIQNIIACVGGLKEIHVRLNVAPGVGNTRTFTLYRNGSIEASTAITISGTNTTGSVTLGTPLAFSAGDRIWLEMTLTGTPAASRMALGVKYIVTTEGQCQFTWADPHDIGTTGTTYNPIVGSAVSTVGNWGGSGNTEAFPIRGGKTPYTLSGVRARLTTAPGASKSRTLQVDKNNAVAGNPDVLISGTDITGDSAAESVSVIDGDELRVRMVNTSTPAESKIAFSSILTVPIPDENLDFDATLEGNGFIYEDELDMDAATSPETGGPITFIEYKDSNDVTHVVSNHDGLDDPDWYQHGYKLNTVTSMSPIVRSNSNEAGEYVGTDFMWTEADMDNRLRALMDDTFLPNRPVVVRTYSDRLRRIFAVPRVKFRGLTRSGDPDTDMGFQWAAQDYFAAKFSGINQVPKRVITAADFADAPTGLSEVEKTYRTPVVAGPQGYVLLSDQAAILNLTGKVENGFYADDVTRGWYGYNADGSEKVEGAQWYYALGDVYWATPDVAQELERASGGTSTLSSLGLAVPFGYGIVSDVNVSAGGGKGQFSPVYVGKETINGTEYHRFVCFGHAVARITGLYTDDGKTGVGTYPPSAVGDLNSPTTGAGEGGPWIVPKYDNWAAVFGGSEPPYKDINGNRYTIIYGRVGWKPADVAAGYYDTLLPENVRLSISFEGIEDVGDGSGKVITNLFLQRLHMLQNWEFGDYRNGAWLASPTFADDPSLPIIDEDSYRKMAERAGFPGAFVVGHSVNNANSAFVTVGELEGRGNMSSASKTFWNRKGQYAVDYPDLDNANIETVADFSDELHVKKDSFKIKDDQTRHFNVIPFRHTQDYCGRERDGWLSVRSGELEVRDAASIADYSPPGLEIPLLAPTQFLHMIRGRNLETDYEDYDAGTAAAEEVIDRYRRTHRDPPREAMWTMDSEGDNYDLNQVVRFKHFAGSGSSGWTHRHLLIVKHESDSDELEVHFTAVDLERILP